MISTSWCAVAKQNNRDQRRTEHEHRDVRLIKGIAETRIESGLEQPESTAKEHAGSEMGGVCVGSASADLEVGVAVGIHVVGISLQLSHGCAQRAAAPTHDGLFLQPVGASGKSDE